MGGSDWKDVSYQVKEFKLFIDGEPSSTNDQAINIKKQYFRTITNIYIISNI